MRVGADAVPQDVKEGKVTLKIKDQIGYDFAISSRDRTLTIGDELYRQAAVAIYDDVAAPGFPKALVGMAAFEDRRLALDLGGPRLFVERPMQITVGE